uniref:hypothetical protein n=1 Tax=Actinoplanes rectilineatus TaxID=113571 RepID=UPI0005F29A9B
LAALGKATSDAERLDIFEAALKMIRTVADQDTADSLAGMTSTLAGVRLSNDKVEELWRRAMAFDLRDSSVTLKAYNEGARDGARRAAVRLVQGLISFRFDDDPRAAEIAERLVAENPDTANNRAATAKSIDELIA